MYLRCVHDVCVCVVPFHVVSVWYVGRRYVVFVVYCSVCMVCVLCMFGVISVVQVL